MEIKLEDYFSKEEIKDMVEDELRYAVRNVFNNKSEFEHIISNISYKVVWNMIDEQIKHDEQTCSSLLNQKVVEVINNLSSFCVFRKKDIYNKQDSIGQVILEKSIKDSEELIKTKVEEIINNYDFKEINENIEDTIYDCICDAFKRGLER